MNFKKNIKCCVACVGLLLLATLQPKTAQAWCGEGDINEDCVVDILDFQLFIQHYLLTSADEEFYPSADLNQDDRIDIGDFAILISNFSQAYPTPTITPIMASSTPTPAPLSPTPFPTLIPTPTPIDIPQFPSDIPITDWKQWKINMPDGAEIKNLIDYANSLYFYANLTGTGVLFKTPIRDDNATTSNSSYIRSELRERTSDGSTDIYWTTSGKHVLYVRQSINHLPITKPHLVASQVHGCKSCGGSVGSVDDAAVLRLEDQHLFISFNGGKEMIGSNGQRVTRPDVTITRSYQLGTKYEFIMEITDGAHNFYYSTDGNLENAYQNNTAQAYLVTDAGESTLLNLPYGDAYFKVGNYTQSNKTIEGNQTNNPENYGEVEVFKTWVQHQ